MLTARDFLFWWLRHVILMAAGGVVAGMVLAKLFRLADGYAITFMGVTW